MNVTEFIKGHIPLCIGTLGTVVLGYLGYHAVRWIIQRCSRTYKIDRIASNLFNNQNNLITMGQGEYIVFHQSSTGEKRGLSPELYERAFQVLVQYSPGAIMQREAADASQICADRYNVLKTKLKEIDPTLEAAFVPKTLYEMVYLKQCIEEDVNADKVCPLLDRGKHPFAFKKFQSLKVVNNEQEYKAFFENRKCWHLNFFPDHQEHHNEPGIINIASRLNQIMLNTFNPSSQGFTYQQLSTFTENHINFLKTHHNSRAWFINPTKEDLAKHNCENIHLWPGPAINFAIRNTYQSSQPMGIRDDADARIIRHAIALECSAIAQHSLFIFRGSNYKKDLPVSASDKAKAYSLSYGSLFAGALFDAGATAFTYMRRNHLNAYALPIPLDHLANDSPFFIPAHHTLVGMCGGGETFHTRTKGWNNFDVKNFAGMNIRHHQETLDHLKSNMSQNELIRSFLTIKRRAIHLK